VHNNQDGKSIIKRITNFFKTPMFKKIKKSILIMVEIVIPILTVYIAWKTYTLNKTVDLLQLTNTINNEIQAKTDIFYSVELEGTEMYLRELDGETIKRNQKILFDEKKRIAVASLLNTYEYACQQYISNKIDREAFKTLYKEMIEYIIKIPDEYKFDKGKLPAIYQVYTEWYDK